MNTANEIRKKIARIPRGVPFSSAKFLGLAERATVDQVLSRLVKSGKITRIKRGLFVRPKKSEYVGEVLPSPAEVAQAIAEASGAKIEIHGAEAARRFGLSTQVPAHPVFYTSGSSQLFYLGRLPVELKHVAPRKLLLAGRPAGRALSALRYLGKEGINSEAIEQIRQKLPPAEFRALEANQSAMPAWMADALHRYNATRQGA